MSFVALLLSVWLCTLVMYWITWTVALPFGKFQIILANWWCFFSCKLYKNICIPFCMLCCKSSSWMLQVLFRAQFCFPCCFLGLFTWRQKKKIKPLLIWHLGFSCSIETLANYSVVFSKLLPTVHLQVKLCESREKQNAIKASESL